MDDRTRVLVAYATAAGSTAGVAERIAVTLQAAGADVVCRPAGSDLDPAGDHRGWAAIERWADEIAAELPLRRDAAMPAGRGGEQPC